MGESLLAGDVAVTPARNATDAGLRRAYGWHRFPREGRECEEGCRGRTRTCFLLGMAVTSEQLAADC